METDINSKDKLYILCWSAKTWARVIGWIQFIGSLLILALSLTLLVLFLIPIYEWHYKLLDAGHVKGYKFDSFTSFSIVALATAIAISVVGAISGIVLILGVYQENTKKLSTWINVQIFLCVVGVINLVLNFLLGQSTLGLVQDIFGFIFTFFAIYIVGRYQGQLLNEQKSLSETGSEFKRASALDLSEDHNNYNL